MVIEDASCCNAADKLGAVIEETALAANHNLGSNQAFLLLLSLNRCGNIIQDRIGLECWIMRSRRRRMDFKNLSTGF